MWNRLLIVLMRLLLCAIVLPCSGCPQKVVYLPDSEKVYRVKAGDPSPISGYVLSEGTLLRLYKAARTPPSATEP
jgi:hypothetical protein